MILVNFLTIMAAVDIVLFFFAVGKFGPNGVNKGAYALAVVSACWLIARLVSGVSL